MVTLLDTGPILDVMGKLRTVYPNVLHIERPALMLGGESRRSHADHRKMKETELFSSFFTEVTGESPTKDESQIFGVVVDSLYQIDREVTE